MHACTWGASRVRVSAWANASVPNRETRVMCGCNGQVHRNGMDRRRRDATAHVES